MADAGRARRRQAGPAQASTACRSSCCAATAGSTCSSTCARTCPGRCRRASCPAPATTLCVTCPWHGSAFRLARRHGTAGARDTPAAGAAGPRRPGWFGAGPTWGGRLSMERGSNKHSPRLDEEMEHEVEGMMTGRAPDPGRGVEGGRARRRGPARPRPCSASRRPAARRPGPGMTHEEVAAAQRARPGTCPARSSPTTSPACSATWSTPTPRTGCAQLVRQLPSGRAYDTRRGRRRPSACTQEDQRF